MAAEVPNPSSDPSGQSAADDALRAAQEAIKSLQALNSSPSPTPPAPEPQGESGDDVMAAMLAAMREDPGSASSTAKKPAAPTASTMPLPDFGGGKGKAMPSGMELLGDVNLNVRIELGRTKMLLEDVLRLGEGTVVELDKLAGDPVDIYVNDRPVARGEVLVLNDNFCIRVSEVYSKDLIERIENTKPAA